MDPEFWQARWEAGQIGFHLDRVNPVLERWWDKLPVETESPVLVPLCGKSIDMAWLAARGHPVIGVELSQIAAAAFFREQALKPEIDSFGGFVRYRAESVSILCGDVFALDAGTIEGCAAIYDRAALIALPPELRRRYADKLGGLLPEAQQLIVTFNYNQALMDGPPFAVSETEVRQLYSPNFAIDALELDVDILPAEPGFAEKGLDWLTESCFRLTPRSR